jgi:hypothetical protein
MRLQIWGFRVWENYVSGVLLPKHVCYSCALFLTGRCQNKVLRRIPGPQEGASAPERHGLYTLFYSSNIIFFSLALQPPWALASVFQFHDHFTEGRTPWASDQTVARPLLKHRTTQTHTKHLCLVWDSNPRSQRPSERRQFMPSTARTLWLVLQILLAWSIRGRDIGGVWGRWQMHKYCDMRPETGILEREETTVIRQRHYKYISAAINTWSHNREVLEMVFSIRSDPRLHS